MSLNMGRALIAMRTKPGGMCRQCKEELPVMEEYLIFRNWTVRKGKKLQFYILLHPGCVSDYIHKSWTNRPERKNGRPAGSRFDDVDPILKAVRDATLQRRRYLMYKMKTEERPHKLWQMVTEIRAGLDWLDAQGLTKAWEKKRTDTQLALLLPKIQAAERFGKEHPHLSAEIGS